MFCLNELTVLVDTALQSTGSPSLPPILSPAINTTIFYRNPQKNPALFFSNFAENKKKIYMIVISCRGVSKQEPFDV